MKAEHGCNNDNRVVKFGAQRCSEHPESLLQYTESLFNTSSCPDMRPIVPLFTWSFWCTQGHKEVFTKNISSISKKNAIVFPLL